MQNKLVKVAIVLPEDKKEKITFVCPQAKYFWETAGVKIFLKRGKSYTIVKQSAPRWELWQEEKKIYEGEGEAQITSSTGFTWDRNGCLQVKKIVAGRHFHWRKEIDETLPGDFVVECKDEGLIFINLLPLEAYIACVAVSEMSATAPRAFLQAQMVVARSWFLAHAENKHGAWDACNDDCCQRYQGLDNINDTVLQISQSTQGQVLMYEGKICDTRYSKSCGGKTEDARYVWGIEKDYLCSFWDREVALSEKGPDLTQEKDASEWIESSSSAFCDGQGFAPTELLPYLGKVDVADHYYRWQVKYSAEELLSLMKEKAHIADIEEVLSFQVLKRGESARVSQLCLRYLDQQKQIQSKVWTSEYEIRFCLHPSFLYSSAFVMHEKRNEENHLLSIQIQGAGWGHGVGLCQIGALVMALQGYDYQRILSHYFPGTTLEETT